MTLDCQGHKILPASPGQPDNPATPAFDPVFSQPQLAVLFNGALGTDMRDCVVEGGFDYGVLAINSKTKLGFPHEPSTISHNKIMASNVAIHLMNSDNFDIKHNLIKNFNRGGAAVHIQFNSDNNVVKANTIVSEFKGIGSLAVPGPLGAANPRVTSGVGAVIVTQGLGPHPTLFNVVVEGNPKRLFQLTIPQKVELTEDFTADNLIQENTIFTDNRFLPESQESGLVFQLSLRTTVREYHFIGPMGVAMRDGQLQQRIFPGKCSLDNSRLCLNDGGCLIPGFDIASKGSCNSPAPQNQNVVWFAKDLVIEGNEVQGPFFGGISTAARDVTIRDNTLVGPLLEGGLAGILLRGKYTLESGGVVTRNRVSNVERALRIDQTFGTTADFSALRISLNDFSDYVTSVFVTGQVTAELSIDGSGDACAPGSEPCIGNYWGLSCEISGGFDPSAVVYETGGNVADSHPFGEPVSETFHPDLPQTCSMASGPS